MQLPCLISDMQLFPVAMLGWMMTIYPLWGKGRGQDLAFCVLVYM